MVNWEMVPGSSKAVGLAEVLDCSDKSGVSAKVSVEISKQHGMVMLVVLKQALYAG